MRTLFLSVVVFIATGCVSSDYVQLGDKTYPPRPDDWVVDVFIGTGAPVSAHKSVQNAKPASDMPKNATVVGRVDTNGAPAASWNSMINSAKNKARAIGGDGLIIGNWGHYVSGVGAYGSVYHSKTFSMTVVRFRK